MRPHGREGRPDSVLAHLLEHLFDGIGPLTRLADPALRRSADERAFGAGQISDACVRTSTSFSPATGSGTSTTESEPVRRSWTSWRIADDDSPGGDQSRRRSRATTSSRSSSSRSACTERSRPREHPAPPPICRPASGSLEPADPSASAADPPGGRRCPPPARLEDSRGFAGRREDHGAADRHGVDQLRRHELPKVGCAESGTSRASLAASSGGDLLERHLRVEVHVREPVLACPIERSRFTGPSPTKSELAPHPRAAPAASSADGSACAIPCVPAKVTRNRRAGTPRRSRGRCRRRRTARASRSGSAASPAACRGSRRCARRTAA